MAKTVSVKCKDCGKSSFVTVGVKRYCAECGTVAAGSVKTTGILDLRPARPSAARPTATAHPTRAGRPATALHGKQVGGVVDLRQAKLTPVSAKAPRQRPPAPRVTNIEAPKTPGRVVIPKPAHERPAAINKFPQRKHNAAIGAKPEPAPKPLPAPELPNHVKTQINAMAQQAIAADRAAKAKKSRSSILSGAIAAAREPQSMTPATIFAITAAFVLMGGLIWTQNAPKWNFRSAAVQAGIEASLPTYLPTSYVQSAKPVVKPGEVTLSYNGPSAQKPLVITQKRTSMDAGSLRDSVVSHISDNFSAVPGQGLTVYLYNGGDVATWVNHGVWYTVSGAGSLGRDQILKIAYGL